MADFIYQEPYPIEKDTTEYELLTTDYVKVVECDGRKILKVDPKGLELLSKRAYSDVSFYLRPAHLQKLANILEDPEASSNDKFVAYTMLMNQAVAAEGELPTCQDTGTAICIGHKGEDVYTGADDAECIAKGVYETYKERNLRYSQVVPFTMTDEKNSGTNLPAQIDIYVLVHHKGRWLCKQDIPLPADKGSFEREVTRCLLPGAFEGFGYFGLSSLSPRSLHWRYFG